MDEFPLWPGADLALCLDAWPPIGRFGSRATPTRVRLLAHVRNLAADVIVSAVAGRPGLDFAENVTGG